MCSSCTGYLTSDGRKIGKSRGGTVDPRTLVSTYGVDAVRYYLLSQFRAGDDGDFSEARLISAYHTDLADKIGNLVRRVTSLVEKRASGRLGALGPVHSADASLLSQSGRLAATIDEAIARYEVHEAIRSIVSIFEAANRYVDATAPWRLDGERLQRVLHTLVEAARAGASELAPFLPAASKAILAQLGTEEYVPGGEVLFPKRTG
jgi:methionyl-tRNA synthetase